MFHKFLLFLLLVPVMPGMLMAHSGHGAFHGHELVHYLLSPAHAIPVATGLILLVVLYGRNKWAKQKQQK